MNPRSVWKPQISAVKARSSQSSKICWRLLFYNLLLGSICLENLCLSQLFLFIQGGILKHWFIYQLLILLWLLALQKVKPSSVCHCFSGKLISFFEEFNNSISSWLFVLPLPPLWLDLHLFTVYDQPPTFLFHTVHVLLYSIHSYLCFLVLLLYLL